MKALCILIAAVFLAASASASDPVARHNDFSFRDGYITGKNSGMVSATLGHAFPHDAALETLAAARFRHAKGTWSEIYWQDGFIFGFRHGYRQAKTGDPF